MRFGRTAAKVKKSIEVTSHGRQLEFDHESSVLEVLVKNQVAINHSCGGMGSCTTCRIIIESDSFSIPEPNHIELERAKERGFKKNERLSCQLCPIEGLKIRVP